MVSVPWVPGSFSASIRLRGCRRTRYANSFKSSIFDTELVPPTARDASLDLVLAALVLTARHRYTGLGRRPTPTGKGLSPQANLPGVTASLLALNIPVAVTLPPWEVISTLVAPLLLPEGFWAPCQASVGTKPLRSCSEATRRRPGGPSRPSLRPESLSFRALTELMSRCFEDLRAAPKTFVCASGGSLTCGPCALGPIGTAAPLDAMLQRANHKLFHKDISPTERTRSSSLLKRAR